MKNNQKKLMQLTIPFMLEMAFTVLLGTVDTLMISKYSEPSVGAIGNANTVLGFLTVLFNISSVGVSIVVSQYLGAKQQDKCGKVLSQGVIFNLLLGLSVSLFFLFCNQPLLELIHTPEDIIGQAQNYLRLIAFTLPLQALTAVMSANLKAHSKPYYITVASLVVNILNVLLNYVLIYGRLGLPELGYLGTAIATMACHVLTFIYAVIVTRVVLKENIFKIHFSKMEMLQILKFGGPSAFENICYNISQLLVLAEVNKLLTDMVIARTYINTAANFTFIFSVSFGSANAILVGYAVGRNDYKEARRSTRTAMLICYPCLMTIVAVLNIFGRQIFGLVTETEGIIDAIMQVLPILFMLETGRCVNLIYINALKSAGDTIYPVICAVFSMFVLAAFGSYVFTEILPWGLVGIYFAVGLDEFVRGILILIRFRTNHWENKGLIKKEVPLLEGK